MCGHMVLQNNLKNSVAAEAKQFPSSVFLDKLFYILNFLETRFVIKINRTMYNNNEFKLENI